MTALGEVAVSSKSPDACTEFQPTQLFTTLYANFGRAERLKDMGTSTKKVDLVRAISKQEGPYGAK
jgi:hypothetical protein